MDLLWFVCPPLPNTFPLGRILAAPHLSTVRFDERGADDRDIGEMLCGPVVRRERRSAHFMRCYDGRQVGVAAAIETSVTNKAGDAGSSCKVEDFACACSWPRRSCRVTRGQDGRPKGKSLQASGRCHEQSTNHGGACASGQPCKL